MAPPKAPHRKPAPAKHTETADSLERVVGARRMESACGPEQGTHGPLINADQERGDVTRCVHWLDAFIG
jgi:hypothetical protein